MSWHRMGATAEATSPIAVLSGFATCAQWAPVGEVDHVPSEEQMFEPSSQSLRWSHREVLPALLHKAPGSSPYGLGHLQGMPHTLPLPFTFGARVLKSPSEIRARVQCPNSRKD